LRLYRTLRFEYARFLRLSQLGNWRSQRVPSGRQPRGRVNEIKAMTC
jgi:hypothetical protein